jgi:hypothetical protein
MPNYVFQSNQKYLITSLHLQGSTVQRQASEKEKSKELPTLKDNDFLEENYKLMLPADAKAQLLSLLKSDTGKPKTALLLYGSLYEFIIFNCFQNSSQKCT